MMMRCQQCGVDFDAWRSRQRFCSQGCYDVSRTIVDVAKLAQMVTRGETKAEIARQFGVSYITARRWVATYGFEQAWREQRYA